MGFGMAGNIRKKIPSSSILYICDVYRPACDRFISEFKQFGPIEIAESAKEAAANAKVFISSLPSSADVHKVYLDDTNGLIAAPADSDRLILETSTIESSSARKISDKLATVKSGFYVDTPISVCREHWFSYLISNLNRAEFQLRLGVNCLL
jgi:3-hydroxyisobutyrate dehydrogenase